MVNITSNKLIRSSQVASKLTEARMQTAMKRISSGKRVNTAADDAAGLAVMRRMEAQILSIRAAIQNNLTANSAIDAALGGIEVLQNMAVRMHELAVKANNGVYTNSDRVLANQEILALKDEYVRMAEHTTINDTKLLDGSFLTGIQVGSNVSENVDIDIDGILKRFDISAQGRATGSSIELVRELAIASGQSVSDTPLESRAIVTEPGKIATGTSEFDVPANQIASVTTAFDYLDLADVTNGSSAFDTPVSSDASGTSALSILPTNNAMLASSNFTTMSNLVTGTSNLNISPTSTATINSSLNYHTSSAAEASSNLASSVPLTSSASVSSGGASTLNPLAFENGNFSASDSSSTASQSGSTIQLPGWEVYLSQVSIDSGELIAGYAPPADTNRPSGVDTGDSAAVTGSPVTFSYRDSANDLILQTNNIRTSGNGIAHGPYIVSDEAIGLKQNDQISFQWEGLGGEQIDVMAYLLNVDTGTTIKMLDFTDTDGGAVAAQTISQTIGAGEDGRYKFIFISGSYDIDSGGTVASEVAIRNISVTQGLGNVSSTSSADVTLEAMESNALTITRDKLAQLDTIAGANLPNGVTPYSISGTDASYFTISNQSTGEISSTGALLRATKSNYEFTVTYRRADGGFHKENITLNLLSSLGASSTIAAQEANSVTIARSELSLLDSYVSANPGGGFALSGTDAARFTLDPNGNLTSTGGPMEFDSQTVYNLTVEYTSVGGDVFTNDIVLNLTDTLDSTANATAEEAQLVTLEIADFTASQTYAAKPVNAGGTFSLAGTDAGLFQFNGSGDIVSRSDLLLATQPSYNFELRYTTTSGDVHIEDVTLTLSEALQASSTLTVNHNVIADIPLSGLGSISNFASSGAGVWSLAPAASDASSPTDDTKFSLDIPNNRILSNSATDFNSEPRYDFDVIFTRTSDGVQFRETVTLNVRNPLARTTRIEAEETDQLTIALDQLPWSEDEYNTDPTGSFSLSGADAGLFTINPTTGEISSLGNMRLTGNRVYNLTDSYDFNVDYLVGGITNSEQVTLTITEALQAQTSVSVPEATLINLGSDVLERLDAFASRDRYRGVYSIDTSSGDHSLFSIDPTGNITNAASLDFNDRADHLYQFDVLYTASDNTIFRDSVDLLLTDTFGSTANFTVEEADQISLSIDELTSSKDFRDRYTGGSFSLSGVDASYFSVDTITGDILSDAAAQIITATKNPFRFSLVYTANNGDVHTEDITLSLTESLHSDAVTTVQETDDLTILVDDLVLLKAFALRDGNGGSYSLSGPDADLFQFSAFGNLETVNPILIGDRADDVFRVTVNYTETAGSGGDTFAAELEINLAETYSSTANLSIVEGSGIIIKLEDLASSASYYGRHKGGSFSLTGLDASKFNVDTITGSITNLDGSRLFIADQSSYSFNLVYDDPDGNTHTEAITLTLDPLLNSVSAIATAQEADEVELSLSDLSQLSDFIFLKGSGGSLRFEGADSSSFELLDNNKIVNRRPIDFADRRGGDYRFSVSYVAPDNSVFTQNIALGLDDTYSAKARFTAEDADEIRISLNSLTSSYNFERHNPGGSYSLIGEDAGKFEIDDISNSIRSRPSLVRHNLQQEYKFSLVYKANNGLHHEESITLGLTPSSVRKSVTSVRTIESKQIQVDGFQPTYLQNFAKADNFEGKFTLKGGQENLLDGFFEIDETGTIKSDSSRPLLFSGDENVFRLEVSYMHSDGIQEFVDELHVTITNDYRNDIYRDLDAIDISTVEKSLDATLLIRNISEHLLATQTYLGATKNRLGHNLEFQLFKALKMETAIGRIVDADIAKEMSGLIKQQLLQNAAQNVISKGTQIRAMQASLLFSQ